MSLTLLTPTLGKRRKRDALDMEKVKITSEFENADDPVEDKRKKKKRSHECNIDSAANTSETVAEEFKKKKRSHECNIDNTANTSETDTEELKRVKKKKLKVEAEVVISTEKWNNEEIKTGKKPKGRICNTDNSSCLVNVKAQSSKIKKQPIECVDNLPDDSENNKSVKKNKSNMSKSKIEMLPEEHQTLKTDTKMPKKKSKLVTFNNTKFMRVNESNAKYVSYVVEKEEDVKDEDINAFCDDIDDTSNNQFEDWVRQIEEKLHSNKNK